MHIQVGSRWLYAAGAALIAVGVLVAAPLATEAQVSGAIRPTGVRPAASSYEAFYNPFGDPWATRTAANPSIPVALTPPCNRIGPKGALENPPQEELRFLATSSSPLIFEECSFLFDATDNVGSQRQKAYVAALKAANPGLKYLAFTTPSTAPVGLLPGTGPYPVGLADIDAHHEEWYLHINGQPADRNHRVPLAASQPGIYLYDIANPAFRAYMVQRTVASMTFHGLGGVVIEQCGDYPVFEPSTPPPPALLNSWADGCVAFLQALKQAAPDKQVIFLSYSSIRAQAEGRSQVDSEQLSYDFYVRRSDVSDGMFWEDPLGAVKASAFNPPSFVDFLFARFRHVQDYAASRDNYIGVFVNTNAQGQSSFASTNSAEQHAFANYYLAAYLAMFRGSSKTPLVYYTPAQGGDQFRSATHFAIWNTNVGSPAAPVIQVGEARYQREFSQARVFVNGSDSPWPVSLTDRPFLTTDGQVVTSATIQPRTGAVFRAIDSAAACTPRPAVVVSSTRVAPGSLQITVTAGIGLIRSIQFGPARAGLIDIPDGVTGAAGNFTHTPSNPTTALTLTVRRNGGGPTTVPFTVIDWCGEWRTFVGGGPTAF